MATRIRHAQLTSIPDDGVSDVGATEWNNDHTVISLSIVEDTTPKLGGQLQTTNHTIMIPAETGDDHRSAGLDGSAVGGSAFNFRTPAGAKVLELRSGSYLLGSTANYDSDYNQAYFFVSNGPAQSEVLIGVDQDQPATHHTRLGLKSHAGDAIVLHYELDGPNNDYPSFRIHSASSDTGDMFSAYQQFISWREIGGDGSAGTTGAIVSAINGDYLGGIEWETYTSSLAREDMAIISVTVDDVTHNAEYGSMYLGTMVNGVDRVNLRLQNGVHVGTNSTAYTMPGLGSLQAEGFVKTGAIAATSLPAATTANMGARHYVTDASTNTFMAPVVGGSTYRVPVVSNGTGWVIG
jgi:hypothetical protein